MIKIMAGENETSISDTNFKMMTKDSVLYTDNILIQNVNKSINANKNKEQNSKLGPDRAGIRVR